MAIEHRHIEVFRAVMQAGSVTGAAALLHTSQPTISRDLARLEHLLGFPLFDRIHGRLRPTAQAQTLYEEVQRAFIGLDQVIAAANSLGQFSSGKLSIACQPAFAHALLPAACRRFLSRFPEIGLSITPQESPLLEEWLTAQRHDLGLTEQNTAPPGTVLTVLLEADELCVLPAGHPLLARQVLTPEDFAGLPFVSLSPGDVYRRQLDAVFQQHGIERQMRLETHSAVSVCSLVQEGLGLAIVNPLTALAFAGLGVELRRFSIPVPFRICMVQPEYRPSSPLVAEFMADLKTETADVIQHLSAL